jgi:hypothetical protein
MEYQKYTVFVNSCDAFDDCWGPFFFFLQKFWPTVPCPVVLNTESRTFSNSPVKVVSTSLNEVLYRDELTWSECLYYGLDYVKTPLVLYLQEDYFLTEPVQHALIGQLADQMLSSPEIACIGLSPYASPGPFVSCDYSNLIEIARNAKYRISLQASLWRVERLRWYLRFHENAWMFELFGTERSKRTSDLFLRVGKDAREKGGVEPIDYIFTGITKGMWHHAVPEFFRKNGVSEVDFSRRGMYRQKSRFLGRLETLSKLLERPSATLKSLFELMLTSKSSR